VLDQQRASLTRHRAADETRLDRVLAANADDTVRPEEARQQLAAIRKRIEDAGMALERLEFDERRLERLELERDRLTALAMLTLEIRRVPGGGLFMSARRDEQQEIVRRVLRLKSRSEWARLREAAKRARRAS
jgi:hypothetical protein